LVVIFCIFGLAFAQDQIIKNDHLGNCYSNNTNCDWIVGLWVVSLQVNAYSFPENGYSTIPLDFSTLWCTEPYTIPGTCVYGYREDSGLLVSTCYFDQGVYKNPHTGITNEKTLPFNQVSVQLSFQDGSQSLTGPCIPFRQLATDSIVGNYWDGFSPLPTACPNAPSGVVSCVVGTIMTSFYFARRRISPSRLVSGFSVTKNFNTPGSCNINNNNCDWFAGSWEGYIITSGYSQKWVTDQQDTIFALTPNDLRCTQNPYKMSYYCEIGYSPITGVLIAYCRWGNARIIALDSTIYHSKPYNQYLDISSLHNGIQYTDPIADLTFCAPMDRLDTDTVLLQIAIPWNPSSKQPNCTQTNLSPNVNVECQEGGLGKAVQVSYATLGRIYPSSASSLPITSLFSVCALLFVLFH